MKTFTQVIGDIRLDKYVNTIKEHFKTENINNLCFENYEGATHFLIERYINVNDFSNSNLFKEIKYIDFLNPQINFIKNCESSIVNPEESFNRSCAQMNYFVLREKKLKTFFNKLKNGPFEAIDKVMNLCLVTERIANFSFPEEIKMASSKSSRIMIDIFSSRNLQNRLIANENGELNDTQNVVNHIMDINKALKPIAKETEELVKEIVTEYVERWFNDGEEREINFNFDELFFQAHIRYASFNFYNLIKESDALSYFALSADEKIETIINAEKEVENFSETFELLANDLKNNSENFGTISQNIFAEKKTEECDSRKNYLFFLAHKLDLFVLKEFPDADKIAASLSLIYYLASALIYNNGFSDDEEAARVIIRINDTFAKYYDEAKEIYDFYDAEEEKLIKENKFIEKYDDFDRKVFKKYIALLDMFVYKQEPKEVHKLLFRATGVSAKDLKSLESNSDDTKYVYKNINIYAAGVFYEDMTATGREIFKERNIAFSAVLSQFIVVSKYFEKAKSLKKYEKLYNSFFKMLNRENDAPKLDNELIKFICTNWFNISDLNKIEYFFHKCNRGMSYLKPGCVLDAHELALLLASLKQVQDEETDPDDPDGSIDDYELSMYAQFMRRDILNERRSKFRNSFYESEIEEKDNELKFFNEEIKSLSKEIDSKKDVIKSLNDENRVLKENIEKEIKGEVKKVTTSFKEKEAGYKYEIESLQAEIAKLKAINANLEKDNENLEKALMNEEEVEANVSLADVIGDNKITVVGGRYEKLRDLQNKYPNNITIVTDPNFPENAILNADYVICLYNFLAHGTYYRVKKLMDIRSERFMYCKFDNLDKVEAQLANAIKNSK